MAPSNPHFSNSILSKRLYYCNRYDSDCSAWSSWGRWTFAAASIFVILVIFFGWGRMSSRRRRRNGVQPVYGTGWMTTLPKYPGPPGQGPDTDRPPPPAYSPPAQQPSHTGTTFNTNEGYYGHHEGIQMTPQPPQNTYQPPSAGANNEYYAPPQAPPPNSTGASNESFAPPQGPPPARHQ